MQHLKDNSSSKRARENASKVMFTYKAYFKLKSRLAAKMFGYLRYTPSNNIFCLPPIQQKNWNPPLYHASYTGAQTSLHNNEPFLRKIF